MAMVLSLASAWPIFEGCGLPHCVNFDSFTAGLHKIIDRLQRHW